MDAEAIKVRIEKRIREKAHLARQADKVRSREMYIEQALELIALHDDITGRFTTMEDWGLKHESH